MDEQSKKSFRSSQIQDIADSVEIPQLQLIARQRINDKALRK